MNKKKNGWCVALEVMISLHGGRSSISEAGAWREVDSVKPLSPLTLIPVERMIPWWLSQ